MTNEPLIERLRTRAEIRRKIPRGEPDRISDLLEEAASHITELEHNYNTLLERVYAAPAPAVPLTDTRKLCTCDGAGRGPGRACVVQAGGRLGDLWKCAHGIEGVGK